MLVECPHCQTLFRVTTSQLTAAEARVRCGQCFVVFNALENLRVLDEEEQRALQESAQNPEEPAGLTPPDLELDESRPSRARATRWRIPPWQWLAALLLVLLLALQILWFERARLMQQAPALRPLLVTLCDHLDCRLPPLRDTRAIDLVDRQLYTHPNVPGALMIQATMVNNAAFAQPYPVVELTLSDEQGHPVAMRRFRPEEYLSDPAEARGLMPPGTPVDIRLEVVDPGSKALAYEFRFL